MILRQKSLVFGLGCFLGIWVSPALDSLWKTLPSHTPTIDVHFSPGGHCANTIIQRVQKARHSILVMAYSLPRKSWGCPFTAHQKGVTVKVLIDRSQINGVRSQSTALLKAGIPMWIDAAKGIAHDKVIILDDQYVLIGSFNFTQNAEKRNAENLLVIHDPSLAKIYIQN